MLTTIIRRYFEPFHWMWINLKEWFYQNLQVERHRQGVSIEAGVVKRTRNPIVRSNAKWAREFRHQLHHQDRVDTQFRSGYIEVISDTVRAPVRRYYIDLWIQKSLLKHRSTTIINAFKELLDDDTVVRFELKKCKGHDTHARYRRRKGL